LFSESERFLSDSQQIDSQKVTLTYKSKVEEEGKGKVKEKKINKNHGYDLRTPVYWAQCPFSLLFTVDVHFTADLRRNDILMAHVRTRKRREKKKEKVSTKLYFSNSGITTRLSNKVSK